VRGDISATQADYSELGPAFSLLAQSEEELCEAFAKIGQCSEVLSQHYEEQACQPPGGGAMPQPGAQQLTRGARSTHRRWGSPAHSPRGQVSKTELAFVEPLKEYCLIAAAARDMLKGRDEAMRRYGGALSSLEQLKAEKARLEQAAANPGSATPYKPS
jgi:hypothetical protein